MNLQPPFINNILNVYKDTGNEWLKQLPKLIAELSKKWNFKFIQTIPDLSFSFVALVEDNETQKLCILKSAPAGSTILSEMHWLQCFKQGVPKIIHADENRFSLLMEYIQPGTTLKNLVQNGQDNEATRIICQTILKLQREQHGIHRFKHLNELTADFFHLTGYISDKLFDYTIELYHLLTNDRSKDVILHGDLHHDNILQCENTWKVIDPHGFIGDPASEVGNMIQNPLDAFPNNKPLKNILETRLKIMSEELPFDPKRIHEWCFCKMMLSAAWSIEGNEQEQAKRSIEIASIIYNL